jgi:RNA polymerase sigma factor (sigma-70 family)
VTLDAFQKGLVELLPRLRRFARVLAGGAVDADDLVQTAVERGLEQRDQWRLGVRLDSWMFTIMRQAWIDDAGGRSRRGGLFVPLDASESDSATVPARPEARDVAAALARLPQDQRLAVALVLVEGLSYGEAAEVMDVPVDALASRLVGAREALLAHFEGGVAA